MNVLCCHTKLHPETERRLRLHTPQVQFVDVSGQQDGYGRAVSDAWTKPGDLMIVEHDIGIEARVIEEFESCPELWCSFPYNVKLGYADFLLETGIGCIRIREEARKVTSVYDVLSVYGSCADCAGLIPGCWPHVEGKICQALEAKGINRHKHGPQLEHYHVYGG